MYTQFNKFHPDLLRELTRYLHHPSDLEKLVNLRQDRECYILSYIRSVTGFEGRFCYSSLPNLVEVLEPIYGTISLLIDLLSSTTLKRFKLVTPGFRGLELSIDEISTIDALIRKERDRDSLISVVETLSNHTPTAIVLSGGHIYLSNNMCSLFAGDLPQKELWFDFAAPYVIPSKYSHIVINLEDFEEASDALEIEGSIDAMCGELLRPPTDKVTFHYISSANPYLKPISDVKRFFWKFLTTFTLHMMNESGDFTHFTEMRFPVSANFDLDEFVSLFPQMPEYVFIVGQLSQMQKVNTQKRVTFYRAPGSEKLENLPEYPIYSSIEECMRSNI